MDPPKGTTPVRTGPGCAASCCVAAGRRRSGPRQLPTLIESHALTDELAHWDLCRWNIDIDQLGDAVAELVDVPEASEPTVRWRISSTLAIQEFQSWTHERPRPWRAVAWTRGTAANRLLEA